jgi:hypothetical protein
MSLLSDAQMKLEGFWDENSNTILTVGALVGFGAALYFTARGAVKADRKIQKLEKQKEEHFEELTTKDILVAAVPEYIPTMVATAFTIACIISNHHINEEQKVALCSAYAMLGKTYEKYRKKTKEIAGEETAKKIDIAMAEDVRLSQNGGVFFYKDDLQDSDDAADQCIFYDSISQLYFSATPKKVRDAEYHINRDLALSGDAKLWNFYHYLGIEDAVANDKKHKRALKKLRWNQYYLNEVYENPWIDFDHTYVEFDSEIDEPSGYYIIQPTIGPQTSNELETFG